MIRGIIWFMALAIISSSCVPNRKYVLLQKNDLNRKDLPVDSVLRTYQLKLSNYRIQPQDMLSIQVETLTPDEFNFMKQLNPMQGAGMNMQMGGGGYMVDNEGNINFAVIGKVNFQGLSIFEAEEKMVAILTEYLREPVVRIRMMNFRFTFVGEMNRQVTSFNPRISMIEAIALAGGLPEYANRENIKIIRQRGSEADVLYVNLLDESFVSSPNFWLQQNDIVVVSTLEQKQARRNLTTNMSLVLSSVSFILFFITLSNR